MLCTKGPRCSRQAPTPSPAALRSPLTKRCTNRETSRPLAAPNLNSRTIAARLPDAVAHYGQRARMTLPKRSLGIFPFDAGVDNPSTRAAQKRWRFRAATSTGFPHAQYLLSISARNRAGSRRNSASVSLISSPTPESQNRLSGSSRDCFVGREDAVAAGQRVTQDSDLSRRRRRPPRRGGSSG
jgi:hypothetical protein